MTPKVSDDPKDSTRQEILAAARRVFLVKGFATTVMRGMSTGGEYAYFLGRIRASTHDARR